MHHVHVSSVILKATTRRTHTDPCYYGWAVSWTTGREVPAQQQDAPSGGSSFVDVTLGVIVKAAAATMQAFRPDLEHGTTPANGTVNRGLSNNFDVKPAIALEQLHARGFQGTVIESMSLADK